jgi:hypothetical protein
LSATEFQQHKETTLAALQAHHQRMTAYHQQHPHLRIGTGPKR